MALKQLTTRLCLSIPGKATPSLSEVVSEIESVDGKQDICFIEEIEVRMSHLHNTTFMYFICFTNEIASHNFTQKYNMKVKGGWTWYLMRLDEKCIPATLIVNRNKVFL